jgi:ADP-ribose pyrophosphatase
MQDKELRETVIKGGTIYDGRIIKLEKWSVRLPNGSEAEREIVLHNGAAAIVPVDRKGYVTLVRQFRVAIGRLMLEIPAGKLDFQGEDPFDCARRELEEETGLRAGKWQKLAHVVTTPGFCTERIALYLATDLTQAEQHTDHDEFLSLERMPLSEAIAKVLQGEIEDAKSCLGLLLAQKALGESAFMRQEDALYTPRRQDFTRRQTAEGKAGIH